MSQPPHHATAFSSKLLTKSLRGGVEFGFYTEKKEQVAREKNSQKTLGQNEVPNHVQSARDIKNGNLLHFALEMLARVLYPAAIQLHDIPKDSRSPCFFLR